MSQIVEPEVFESSFFQRLCPGMTDVFHRPIRRSHVVGTRVFPVRLSQIARRYATAGPFEFEAFSSWATTSESLTQLRDCDLLFCCVDQFAPRVPLNDLAYAQLSPQ